MLLTIDYKRAYMCGRCRQWCATLKSKTVRGRRYEVNIKTISDDLKTVTVDSTDFHNCYKRVWLRAGVRPLLKKLEVTNGES